MEAKNQLDWSALLKHAVEAPGEVSAAYAAFHGYSLGNQLLAAFQAHGRGLPLGPINTYKGWVALNRQVKKGEKAIALLMPVTMKRKKLDERTGVEDEKTWKQFIHRNNWFLLAQTDGEDYRPAERVGTWNRHTAIASLDVREVPFEHPDGNCMGMAWGREVAVSTLCPFPEKTFFHELAHVLLGHTANEKTEEFTQMPMSLQEVEAEATAYLCIESLGLKDGHHCRGYIQHYLRGHEIPEQSARRAMAAADKILKAGYPQQGGQAA
jgi:antirestriction protein ArdC